MTGRHLLDIASLAPGEAEALIGRAVALAGGAAPRRLDGEVAQLFWEPSTRTRVSFELAARRVGLHSITVDPDRSSSVKGETVDDTVGTLAAMGIAALVVRHAEAGIPERAAAVLAASGVAVINAGDGTHAHPSQALLDAATLLEEGIDWPTARIVLLGDLRHSRVARSAFALYRRLGVGELRMAGPPELLPDPGDPAFAEVRRYDDPDAALDGVDVVGCLRIQRERIDALDLPDVATYHASWGLTAARAERLSPGVRVLHPGPVNRGIELDPEVADGPRSRILHQVRMGVFLRMAVYERALAAFDR
ncbi:aspartate carbamoyltransferase catalytic subunit [Wenzhouxiangella sp. XN79A]|uniref:aspartate carbamoyltransferase catalytic subunit n=1 Tax=Wenzhouxiangella sp. XN79A TaxID=2724193 RepID=UPI00144A80E5|nr:aspartate carbamoyltransferase catalytic subunit [Wenzhouxiangella sp. XN79A]NKI35655.1 aspartate carbamoyltransferase catalytic subunit [Wenzhouxiangella sp. XN79A]